MLCRVNSLLFADDAALIYNSEECLQRMVNEMGVMCGWIKLYINVNKSKVMKVSKTGELKAQLNGEKMELLNCFSYLGVDLSADGVAGAERKQGVGEFRKVAWVLKNVWNWRKVTT